MRYEEARDNLKAFSDSKDLSSLQRTVDNVASEMLSQGNREDYVTYLLDVCNLLSTIDFEDYGRQRALIQKYAEAALEQPAAIPLETEIQLLLHIYSNSIGLEEAITAEDWAEKWRAAAERGLRTLRQLENEMEKDFNFDDLPVLNVAPPQGTIFSAGVAPEQITDPQLRAEYEAAIAKNQQKVEAYTRQRKLRDLYRLFSPWLDRYLTKAYSRPRFDPGELQQLLDEYVSDEGRKAAILDAVRRGIATGSE